MSRNPKEFGGNMKKLIARGYLTLIIGSLAFSAGALIRKTWDVGGKETLIFFLTIMAVAFVLKGISWALENV